MLLAGKKIFLIVLLLSALKHSYGQQDAMYSQYMFNTLAINPAYAGSRNVISATALYRSQWVGIKGAPETQTLSIDGSSANKKVGLGLQLFNDQVGETSNTGVYGTYAYRLRFDKSTLAFGLQAGVSRFSGNYGNVDLDPAGAPDAAFAENVTKLMPNVGAGVYFNSDRFYFGVSVPHLLNHSLNDDKAIISNGLIARQYLHLFISTGYVFDLGEDVKLKPSVLFKGVSGAPVQFDFNTNVWFYDTFSIGAQYRSGADVAALAEVQVSPQFRLGYAYDYSVSSLRKFNSGSHEIMLRYEFGSNRSKMLSPRYF